MKLPFVYKFTAGFTLLAGAAVLLSACGQYGDLYLPEDTRSDQAQQQQTEPSQDKDKLEEQSPPQDL